MAQKNRLQYIILGLLNERPQSGYDLTKSFDADIGEFWNANHSQIYPLLKRMEDQELITHKTSIVGQKLEKKIYLITQLGTNIFKDWLHSPSILDQAHDEFILKLYFISNRDNPQIKIMVAEQLQLHQAKLNTLKQQKITKFPDQEHINQDYGHFLVLNHAINREESYLSWLNTIE